MADNLTPKEEFLLNPVEEHNITDAAVASFETNFKHPVKVTVPITPKQDLHGYNYPWPLGGSKNLAKYAGTGYYNSSGVFVQDDVNGRCEPVFIASGTTVTSSTKIGRAVASHTIVVFRDITCTDLITRVGPVTDQTLSYTATEDCYIVAQINAGTTGDASSYKMSEDWYYNTVKAQLELGDTATDYIPCENICPINGWTGVNVDIIGKNLLGGTELRDAFRYMTSYKAGIGTDENGDYVSWTNITNANRKRFTLAGAKPFKESTRYTFIFKVKNGAGLKLFVLHYSDGSSSIVGSANSGVHVDRIVSDNNKTLVGIELRQFGAENRIYYNDSGVFEGAVTASEYEPYSATTLPISWKHAEGTYNFTPIRAGEGDPSPDNVRPISPALTLTRDDNSVLTVYGGSITFRDDGTSVLEDKYYCGLIPNDMIWSTSPHDNYINAFHFMTDWMPIPLNASGTADCISDKALVFSGTGNPGDNRDFWITLMPKSGPWLRVFIRKDLVTTDDTAGINEFLSNNPIYISYQLQTPIAYTLSKAETQRAIAALGDKVTTTIYSGTVTLNEDGSADIVCDTQFIDLSNNPALNNYNYTFGGITHHGVGLKAAPKPHGAGPAICTHAIATNGISATPFQNGASNALWINATANYLWPGILDTLGFSDYTEYNAWASTQSIGILYPLVTPITYHFHNVGQLKAFLGQNNVWSDIGNVNVKYLTQNSATGLEYRGDRALELRRRAMIGDAPTIHTTVGSEGTGGLASFKSYIKAPVKKIEIPFGPKQDLHGYDHPWPAGGSINLFNPDATLDNQRTDNVGVAINYNGYCVSDWIPVVENTNYYASHSIPSASGYGMCFYDENKQFLRYYTVSGGGAMIKNSGANAAYLRVTSPLSEKTSTIVAQSDTVVSFIPYENICPIEGRDWCNVYTITNGIQAPLENRRSDFTMSEDGVYEQKNKNSNPETWSYGFRVTQVTVDPGAYIFWFDAVKTTTNAELSAEFRLFSSNNIQLGATSGYNKQIGFIPVVVEAQTTIGFCIKNYNGAWKLYYKSADIPLIFNQAGDHSFLPIQEGSGNPSPENVRPIHPGLTFTRDDDSVLTIWGGKLIVNADGTGTLNSTWKRMDMSKFSTISAPSSSSGIWAHAFNMKNWTTRWDKAPGATQMICEVGRALQYASNYCIWGTNSTADMYIYDDTISTIAEFKEKYAGYYIAYQTVTTTYTLSVAETNRALEALGLTQHIGPIYGGTVTINPDGSADVAADNGQRTFNGLEGWTIEAASGAYDFIFKIGISAMKSGENIGGLTNYIKRRETNAEGKIGGNFCYQLGWNDRQLYILNASQLSDVSDLSSWKVYLAEHPVQLVYPLATPQTYHFSNLEQLKVWLGENNFWCDISDDITVKYWNRG